MYPVAKNITQLISLLRQGNYSTEDIKRISHAYQLVQQLFSFHFRPTGDTFISHLVGTASILTSLHTSIEIINAGLLHASYVHGAFAKTSNKDKRQKVKDTTGDETEEYIYKYTLLKWNSKTIPLIKEQLNLDNIKECNVILIRLANEFDDNLKLSPFYCPDADKRINYIQNSGDRIIKIADLLGYNSLASSLEEVFNEIISCKKGITFEHLNNGNRSYSVIPDSYRKRLIPVIYSLVNRGNHFLNKILFNQ